MSGWRAARRGACRPWLAWLAAGAALLAPQAGLRAQAGGELDVVTRATQLDRSGRREEAAALLEAYLAGKPDAVSALVTFAQVAIAARTPERVIDPARRAVRATGGGGSARQVLVRALIAAGRTGEALAEARRWREARPEQRTAWLEEAAALRTLGRPGDAVRTLRAGRERTGGEDVFAQELGSVLAEAGRYPEAAAEWVRVLRWGDAGLEAVERQLDGAPDPEAAEAALREVLTASSLDYPAARSAVVLAVRRDRDGWGRSLAEAVVEGLPARGRRPLLRDLVHEARASGQPETAGWAARRLATEAASAAERARWRSLAAALALEAGRPADAEAAWAAAAKDAAPESELRREALRRLFELRVADRPDEAAELLEAVRTDSSASPREVVEMALALADARAREGNRERADTLLELAARRAAGDAALAARVQGRRGLQFLWEGRPGRAREALRAATVVASGDPAGRTRALELVEFLAAADSSRAAELGTALWELRTDDEPSVAVTLARRWAAGPAWAGRPAGLAILAGSLDREGHPGPAETVRKLIVETHPEDPRAADALLSLARGETDRGGAAAWLERLILEWPESALAPVARRLLSELRDEVPPEPEG